MKLGDHGPDFASLRALIDSLPALIHTGRPDGYLDFFNQRWLEFVGLRLEDLEGWKWTSAVHPDDVAGLVARWRGCLVSGEPLGFEARVRRADGEYRWMLHHKVAVRDESGTIAKWYGSSVEIEDRKRAEFQIRAHEAELQQILDFTPQHLGVLGPDGTPLHTNHVALEYFGIDVDQWRADGSRLDLVHPDDREHFLGEREMRFLAGAAHEFEARLLGRDGKFRYFLFRLNPLKDERGQITRWFGTAIDINDRKQTEDRLQRENVVLRDDIDQTSMFEEIVGSSDAIRHVLGQVAKVAPTDSTILISGETGTGKELFARAIHKRSNRSDRAFICVNCGAIAPSLIASELFGHEKGAFTGALQRRIGHFEAADGGTIFLDEIGDLPMEMQSALLRVLQEREFQRVGSSQPVSVDVRVLVATNSDLRSAVNAGKFREDLYFRLNVFPIRLPPLRERVEDIAILVDYLVDRYAKKAGKRFGDITSETLDLFQKYHWPGNIRELQNIIERAVILCDGKTFSIDERWLSQESSPASGRVVPLVTSLEDRERQMIEEALAQSSGKISGPTGAAAKLGIPRQTLDRKILSLRIDKHRFKPF